MQLVFLAGNVRRRLPLRDHEEIEAMTQITFETIAAEQNGGESPVFTRLSDTNRAETPANG